MKRKGWRGPLTNVNYTSDWFEKLENINWKIRLNESFNCKEVNQFSTTIGTKQRTGVIEYKDISTKRI